MIYTLDDIIALSQTIYGEASSEPIVVQIGVAHIVLNRLKRPLRFGGSIFNVVHAPLQFSCFNKGDPNTARILKAEFGSIAYLQAIHVATGVLANLYPDPTEGSDHYFDNSIQKPSWANSMQFKIKLGSLSFYKE